MQRRIIRIGWLRWLCASLSLLAVPEPAAAHVKWFCGAIDITLPPLPIGSVLTPFFWMVGAVFLSLLVLGSLLDAGIVLGRWRLGVAFPGGAWFEQLLIRVGVAGYCLCLWNRTAIAPWGSGRTILTPELFSSGSVLGLWQLAVALLLLHRRGCAVAGLGLLGLYGYGVARYGVFWMTDYVYFLGIAGFLIMAGGGARWQRWQLPLLCISLSFSLMWTAVEKFLYPAWTIRVLLAHPDIAAGHALSRVTVVAGFVEFTLAFYLSVGRGLLRVASLVLLAIFLSAMPEFGMLDIVGHLPIIVVFASICLHGPSPWQERLRDAAGRSGIVAGAFADAGLYLATLGLMIALYYGLQTTTHWR